MSEHLVNGVIQLPKHSWVLYHLNCNKSQYATSCIELHQVTFPPITCGNQMKSERHDVIELKIQCMHCFILKS